MSLQSTGSVLMVRPTAFGWNPETVESNTFQAASPLASPLQAAMEEFDKVVDCLRHHGVSVLVTQNADDQPRPDAIFPNNWLSTHADGTIFTYPMMSPVRRLERDPAILAELGRRFVIDRHVSLSDYEDAERFLEGTGSLVLDRAHRIAYACESPRTDLGLAARWCQTMGFRLVSFRAYVDDSPVYHTNVLLTIGTRCALVCLEWIEPNDRKQVLHSLEETGHEVVDITARQASAFACNALELAGQGGPVLASSWSLPPEEDSKLRAMLAPHYSTIAGPSLPTIWSVGGGGIRCMLCEIFLERR